MDRELLQIGYRFVFFVLAASTLAFALAVKGDSSAEAARVQARDQTGR